MRHWSLYSVVLSTSLIALFVAVESIAHSAKKNEKARSKNAKLFESFVKQGFREGDGILSYPNEIEEEEESDWDRSDSWPSDFLDRDDEDLDIEENLIDSIVSVSNRANIPYYLPDSSIGWKGPHARALNYARRPFDDPATYVVIDKASLGYKAYTQVPCDCPGLNCDRVFYLDEPRNKWDIRLQQMCLVKAGEESQAMQLRVLKRATCEPYNNCYREGAENSTVARCPEMIGRKVVKSGLSNTEKYGLLFYHNFLRALTAAGGELGVIDSYEGQVANMMEMEWDSALADQAQRLVNTCEYSYDCSYCTGRAYIEPVGQILVHLRSKDTNYMKYLTRILLQASHLEESDVKSFTGGNATGLHSQLLWAETTRVGCGVVQQRVFNRVETFLACNYYPSGNRVGSSIFKEGPPCSQCPSGYPCSRFSKVLCSRYFHTNSLTQQPEQSEQFFALTEKEKKLRSLIVSEVLHETRRRL